MPKENFSEETEKNKELLRQKLEDSSEIKVDPVISLETLLLYVKEKKRIMFIVDKDFNIYLSPGEHRYLLGRLKIEARDCLLSGGSFQILPNEILSFAYHELGPVIAAIPEATQNKIKRFLKSKGVQFR
ncbi:hypothetical protein A3H53_02005 [Candidatus Nomurabacteria bacterium RIFCSPLOWO2_02_FULL_40_10]|uniref:Uncharacterized protein n=2 Tax=Candidatus Nomuraibacteriota TaxID=1752729 RepID=A0A1F6XW79_9BACT|nr:MAG: hypothetical protein A2642_00460 [Candidatus Nomurabacteria bacterium RIFCSPHIGHO2_01_FULL_39_10]OGI98367.1 MAG: hypothetical protein A3H53_02005 [Candidatus Nomurabacteria bacterium RIFCSPLOWO2_02_FULL_40_10]